MEPFDDGLAPAVGHPVPGTVMVCGSGGAHPHHRTAARAAARRPGRAAERLAVFRTFPTVELAVAALAAETALPRA